MKWPFLQLLEAVLKIISAFIASFLFASVVFNVAYLEPLASSRVLLMMTWSDYVSYAIIAAMYISITIAPAFIFSVLGLFAIYLVYRYLAPEDPKDDDVTLKEHNPERKKNGV
jgi:hypothetical protein